MLRITVTGEAGVGKTTVARYINQALKGLGFNAYFVDQDDEPERDSHLLAKLAALVQDKDKCEMEVHTLQLRRPPEGARKMMNLTSVVGDLDADYMSKAAWLYFAIECALTDTHHGVTEQADDALRDIADELWLEMTEGEIETANERAKTLNIKPPGRKEIDDE